MAATATGASAGAGYGLFGLAGGPAVGITEPAAMVIGGGVGWAGGMVSCMSSNGGPGPGDQSAGNEKSPIEWQITNPADKKVVRGRTCLKDAKTGTWWSKDTAGHGGSVWKVYKETSPGKLDWIGDADAQGNFISGKWKSSVGKSVTFEHMISTPEEFVQLRTSEKPEEYQRAASEPAEVKVWLEIIDRYPEMRPWVAHNKTISLEVLGVLARDGDPAVRLAVAMKNTLSEDLFLLLAEDIDDGVRQRISYNKNAPRTALEILARDANDLISGPAKSKLSQSQTSEQ